MAYLNFVMSLNIYLRMNRIQPTVKTLNSTVRNASCWFDDIKMGPTDAIFGVAEAHRKDKNPKKVNLGVGAYRDDAGEPWLLPSIRKAEESVIAKNMNKEYAAIIGIPEFYNKAVELALGKDSPSLKEKRNATVQSVSGTGGLRIGAAFFNNFWKGNRDVYISKPTWFNHRNIFEHAGMKVKEYRYYDAKTCGLDCEGFMEDMNKIPEKSIVILHACAHNPTGVDPTIEQWCELAELFKKRKLFPFLDSAYQGFASGDVEKDAKPMRIFESAGNDFALAQSFSKNMGLYGERVGTFSLFCSSEDEATRVLSQLKIIIRSLYSNPPIHGARIVAEILNNEELYNLWLKDLKIMADRIICMRTQLKEKLVQLGSKRPWDHITNQIGMFCFTGLNPEQVNRLVKEHSIHLLSSGRIAIAGLNTKNVDYVAQAMHDVTK